MPHFYLESKLDESSQQYDRLCSVKGDVDKRRRLSGLYCSTAKTNLQAGQGIQAFPGLFHSTNAHAFSTIK